jgi:hypothetical protein
MSEQAFTKATTLTSYGCECAQDEYTAAIDVKRFPNVYPSYIYAVNGFDVFFYNGKLYKIDVPPEIKNIHDAKGKYSELYGPPSSTEDWPNGVSWVKWENKTTGLMIAYNREKTGTFIDSVPAGTVTLIRYYDKPLQDTLEAQEKKTRRLNSKTRVREKEKGTEELIFKQLSKTR